MLLGVIYKATNLVNGKSYVGFTTKDLSKRIEGHIRCNKKRFGIALRQYGVECFEFSIIDHGHSREELNEKEKQWIAFYNCMAPNGYNLTDGGEGITNPTQAVREKISRALKGNTHGLGKIRSLETREKLSKANKGQTPWCKGRKGIFSEEMKRKIGDVHRGKVVSEETKEKIREKRKVQVISCESRRKQSIAMAKVWAERKLKVVAA